MMRSQSTAISGFTANQGFSCSMTSSGTLGTYVPPRTRTPAPGVGGEALFLESAFAIELRKSAVPAKPGRHSWLEDVYSLVRRAEVDDALDTLFREMDRLFRAGSFRECDSALEALDVKRLDTNTLVALLSVTRRASDKLAQRPSLVLRIERQFRQSEPNRADRLLAGLR